MLRLTLRLLLFGLLLLVGIVLYNALTLKSLQHAYPLATPVSPRPGYDTRLAEAVRLPTITRDEGIADSSAFFRLHQHLRSAFPLCDSLLERKVINGMSLLYKWEGREPNLPAVITLAHMDVVPVEQGTEADWQQPPFSGQIADGYLWGRGTMDMKHMLMGSLEAVELLLAKGFQPRRTVYFAFGHDEEIGGQNGAVFIAQYLEDQGIRFEYMLDEGTFILEDVLPGINRPVAFIGTAERGFVNLKITAYGKGGHSSQPPQETAVGILSEAIVSLQRNPFPNRLSQTTRDMFRFLSPEMPLHYRAVFANLWLSSPLVISLMDKPPSNSVLRSTMAPTRLRGSDKSNVLPITAEAVVNVRILPGESVASVKAHFEQAIADERVNVAIDRQGFDVTEPSPIADSQASGYREIEQAVKRTFGDIYVCPSLFPAGTDSKHYHRIVPNVYRFNPMQLSDADISRFHGTNERISLAAYQKVILFYHSWLENL